MTPIQEVKIREKIELFKDGQSANAIELVKFNFKNGDECEFTVVAQKGLYEIDDRAFFIQPDHCLTDNYLFESFVAPDGNPSKSKLGKGNRIRAIKFNFSTNPDSMPPVYSIGILLPYQKVIDFVAEYVKNNPANISLDKIVGVYKYEEPEKSGSGLCEGDFPSFMYKTDEDNIMNNKKTVNAVVEAGDLVSFSIKEDGSSWTGYFKIEDGQEKLGVCSRSMEKKLNQSFTTAYINKETGEKFNRFFSQEKNCRGWSNETRTIFYTQEEIDSLGFDTEQEIVKDSWVEIPKKYDFYNKFNDYCKNNNVQLALRGEIIGSGLKGSGNKLNPSANKPQQLYLFGVDDLSKGVAVRLNESDEFHLKRVATDLGIPYAESILEFVPTSFQDIIDRAQEIFNEYEKEKIIIEGIVARTVFNNKLSVKVMNPLYDSKK